MKKIAIISAAVALAVPAFAQNVNQTVQVTNEYRSEMPDVEKQGVQMAMPDSLLHFDYKFDYSVFETPYKGAYEFSPYQIEVKPDASVYDGGEFYLRTGAGYVLKPVLDFVYTPVSSSRMGVSVHNSGAGYFGGVNTLSEFPLYLHLGDSPVYDFKDSFGVDMRWQLDKVNIDAKVGYDGLWAGETSARRGEVSAYNLGLLNSAAASVRARSVKSSFMYDFALDYRFTHDSELDVNSLMEHNIRLEGNIQQTISDNGLFGLSFFLHDDAYDIDTVRILTDPQTGEVYQGEFLNLALISATPHFDMTFGRFEVRGGVNLSLGQKFGILPDIRVSTNVLKDMMNVYLFAKGGQRINDFFAMKNAYSMGSALYMKPGIEREILHAALGIQGHVGSHFQYGLSGGSRIIKNTPILSMNGFVAEDIALVYAQAEASWKSERVAFDGDVTLCSTPGMGFVGAFDYPLLKGGFKAVYNWKKRLYAGVNLDACMSRESNYPTNVNHNIMVLPGYVDLGVEAEYRLTSHLGVWLKGGNLLCQKIFYTPMYAEKAPAVTAGISLRF